jgi:hypothetical protein
MAAGGQQKGSNARPEGETGRRQPQGETRRTAGRGRDRDEADEIADDPNAIQGDTMGNPPMDGTGTPLTDDEVAERQAARQEQGQTHSSDLDLDATNEG